MSGRDVAVAAMLGAEEFGFATAPLVTLGCVMARVCQSDTCPVGVATQDPALRKRFAGKPEYVENFMLFVARELREIMASLGIRSVPELVGRTDLLCVRKEVGPAQRKLDLSQVLVDLSVFDRGSCVFSEEAAYDFKLEDTLDSKQFLASEEIREAIENGGRAELEVAITNTDRTVGTLLGAEITRAHPEGLAEDTIRIHCKGSGGQSFGAFIPKGLTLAIEGDSNDYFGKGLSGGKLIVAAPKSALYDPGENILIGNVALYGATAGEAYIAGKAGERFAIRNSGAISCVEGVGEHGCEYMTGGCVVILGPTGKNFAAGMSGGCAYVLDEENRLYRNLNKELVVMEGIVHKNDREELKRILSRHVQYTGSEKGRAILQDFDRCVTHFKKVIPVDYKEMMKLIAEASETGEDPESARIEAFRRFVG